MNVEVPPSVIRSCPVPECPLCGAPGRARFCDLPDRLYQAPGQWTVAQCEKAECNLLWLNPMPVAEDLGLAYRGYFTHGPAQDSLARRVAWALHAVLNALPARCTGLARQRRRMECLFLDTQLPGRLLDVGCGDGRFLHAMRRRGWQVEGLDFDHAAAEQARRQFGLTVHLGQLSEVQLPAESFDAVTLRHVIEHVPNPAAVLADCRRLLRKGGRMVVVTPNTESWGLGRFQAHWMGLDPPRHLHLFAARSLAACARQAGWDTVNTWSSAANADTFFAVSLSLSTRARHAMDPAGRLEVGRALRAVLLQHRESVRLRRQPFCGEELVLEAQK
jgi:ubiquinone/menaquinone biosynthesis C-methylase UbiE